MNRIEENIILITAKTKRPSILAKNRKRKPSGFVEFLKNRISTNR